MIVTTKELFKVAYGKFAVGAYNINNMEQTLGLFRETWNPKPPSSFRSRAEPARMPTSGCWRP